MLASPPCIQETTCHIVFCYVTDQSCYRSEIRDQRSEDTTAQVVQICLPAHALVLSADCQASLRLWNGHQTLLHNTLYNTSAVAIHAEI
jgi:hypothetical protein